jgi:hypothetical protein
MIAPQAQSIFGKMGFDDNSPYEGKVRIAAYLLDERPETQVTHRTGHIGYTSSFFLGGSDALEGVFGDG